MKKLLNKIVYCIGLITVMTGMLIFGLIFIISPNLAANISMRLITAE